MPTLTRESLFQVRLLLEEGRSQDALTILQKVQPQEAETSYDVAYLRGWCFILNRRWDEADQQGDQDDDGLLGVAVDRERLQCHDREQEDNRQPRKQNVQRDFIRRLLPLGAFD